MGNEECLKIFKYVLNYPQLCSECHYDDEVVSLFVPLGALHKAGCLNIADHVSCKNWFTGDVLGIDRVL